MKVASKNLDKFSSTNLPYINARSTGNQKIFAHHDDHSTIQVNRIAYSVRRKITFYQAVVKLHIRIKITRITHNKLNESNFSTSSMCRMFYGRWEWQLWSGQRTFSFSNSNENILRICIFPVSSIVQILLPSLPRYRLSFLRTFICH